MAISKITFEEDEAIKRMATTQEAPSRYKWDESLNGDGSMGNNLDAMGGLHQGKQGAVIVMDMG